MLATTFDALILGTSAKHKRRVHVIRIGVSNDLSPQKIEEQIGQDGRLITTPPTFEWTRNKNIIISKKRYGILL
jgi:hypothetical protein